MNTLGNSGFNINNQFANQLGRGEGKVAENLRNQSGVTHTAKKTTVKKGGTIAEEGSQLSPAAREALKTQEQQHSDHVAEHGHELAHQSGLDVPADDHEQAELQRKRGYDRDQETLAEGPTADGKNYVMAAPDGTKQVMKVEDHDYLKKMDDADFTDAQLLDDIPPKNLEAANAVMDTQMAQGVSKVAVLKSDPKIDAVAETMEIQPAPPLAEPMDIRDTTNDPKNKPLQLELPLEMEQMAARKAAEDLASGNHQEEAMIAGGLPGGGASINTSAPKSEPKPEAQPLSQALQDAHVETAQNEKILAKLDAGALEVGGKTVPQKDGYEAVRNNAQDRFMAAYEELPGIAQQAIHNNMDSIKKEFHEDPTNTTRYNRGTLEEKAAIESGWLAQAAGQFAANSGLSLAAVGGDRNMKLDEANLKHLGDGARHYQQADAAYNKLAAADAPKQSQAPNGATGANKAEEVKNTQEAPTVIKTDGPFPTAEMPATATTQSLKQFSDPLVEAQMKIARSQLNPGQKADLEQLEGDIAKIRGIYKEMNANPNDKELWAKSQSEVAGIQNRIGQVAGKYQQPGALQVTIDPKDGEVYTHLSWSNPQVSPELRQQGYQNMNYTLMSAPGKNDYQLTARPCDQYGRSDGTYVQYRVASDDPKKWQGVAAVVGNQYGVNGYHACTTDANDPTLRTQLTPNGQAMTPGQTAAIKQALGDLNLNWPGGASVDPRAQQQPGQPQQPVAPGYMDYMRYAAQPNYGYYPQAWQPNYPTMPYMNSYPNMPYPPVNYGGMNMGGWGSWGGMGMGGYGGNYGMGGGGLFGMGNGMDFTMKMFAVSSLISSISYPLMMFSMF
ncbi:hypothetical protein JST97_06185 [bacterium]|nr:hypothetical protein [bacterium]